MGKILIFATVFLLIGCAMTYAPPTFAPKDFVKEVPMSKEEILKRAKQSLVLEGYQIQIIDENAGIITTSFRQKKLTENECDCGTTMGLPYIKDNRTVTNVALSVIADGKQLRIKASITGEYLKAVDVVQSITFDCVSTGLIEKRLFEKIISPA